VQLVLSAFLEADRLILALILIAIARAARGSTLTRSNDTRAIAGREDTLKLLTDTERHGPPTTLLGVLLIAAVVGMITERRL